ncbi:bestrophin family protein [Pseudaquabacterium rugosum]|uniref:Bestrophin family ion channel n=1 Tax=Pseudaquabacterium rugosum TaxID=2984194 RepID=A0ABU9BEL2_9BURK
MIVRPRPHWLHLLFVRRGSLLWRILPQQLTALAIALGVALAHGTLWHWKVPLNAGVFSLMGVSLAIFLGFRINASYDRWWEARKLWGGVLIACRNLGRHALTLLDVPPAVASVRPATVPGVPARRVLDAATGRTSVPASGAGVGTVVPEGPVPADHPGRPLVLGLMAFAAAMRNQLRGLPADQALAGLLPAALLARLPGEANPPLAIGLWLGRQLAAQRAAGRLDPWLAAQMEDTLDDLLAAWGSCERIAVTPLPFTYGVILHRSVYTYCLLLPFGLVDAIGLATPLVVGFVSYTFFALEALSDEIEEPFGLAPNDLPLDALVHGVQRSLWQLLGEPVPAPLPLVDGYLQQ